MASILYQGGRRSSLFVRSTSVRPSFGRQNVRWMSTTEPAPGVKKEEPKEVKQEISQKRRLEIETLQEEQSVKEIKKNIKSKSPRFMKFWYALGVAGVVGTTMYYYNERDRHERKVDHIVNMISSNDLETKRQGVKDLDSCLYLEKRFFSGLTEIPQPKSILVERGCVEALVSAYKSGDESIQENASVWLIRLSETPEGRKRLLRVGLEPILETIAKSENPSLWLTSSYVLMTLASYGDTLPLLATERIKSTVDAMYGGSHPLAKLVAAKLEKLFLQNESSKELFQGRNKAELDLLTSPACNAALKSASSIVIPSAPRPINAPVSLMGSGSYVNLESFWAPLLYGSLGSIWGSIRWRLSSRVAGLSGLELGKFVSRHNKVGRYTFFLLLIDPIVQVLITWPRNGIKLPFYNERITIPKEVGGLPVETALPIGGAALFIASGLFAVRYQRYVVLPLIAAGLTAHYDELQEFAQPIAQTLGFSTSSPTKAIIEQVQKKTAQIIGSEEKKKSDGGSSH